MSPEKKTKLLKRRKEAREKKKGVTVETEDSQRGKLYLLFNNS